MTIAVNVNDPSTFRLAALNETVPTQVLYVAWVFPALVGGVPEQPNGLNAFPRDSRTDWSTVADGEKRLIIGAENKIQIAGGHTERRRRNI